MSSIPPLQPSTPANEWGATTLNEIDERAKAEAASSGALLHSVPGEVPPAPVQPIQPIPVQPATEPSTHALPVQPATTAPIQPIPVQPATAAPLPPAASTLPSALPSTLPPTTTTTNTLPPAPTTHSTITSGTYDATYNPAVSTADRYNEAGATAAPSHAQPVQTPGLAIPGSFPTSIAELQSTEAAQQAAAALSVANEKATQAAQVAGVHAQAAAQTAGVHAQAAAQTAAVQAQAALNVAGAKLGNALSGAAQYLPQSLKEQVAPYLPEGTSVTANASHNDTVHATSYPSTELRGAQPGEHVGGVGALPGSSFETGVAMPENLVNAPATAPTVTERLGAYVPQSVKDTAAPYLPASAAIGTKVSASEHDHIHSTSLPTQEFTGAGTETVDGVGALPGAVTERGVAEPEALLNRPTGTVGAAEQPTLTQRAAAYVPDSVKAYIPAGLAATALGATVAASEHDNRHTASMPTSELTGGSSGELPGRVGEEGVAVVPDERVGEQTPTTAGRIAAARDAAYGSAAAAAAAVSHGTDRARETIAPGSTVTTTAAAPHATMSLPTTEAQGLREGEVVGGAGPLPGSINETGVAILPEEKNAPSTPAVHQTVGSGTGVTADNTTGVSTGRSTDDAHTHTGHSTEAAALGTAAAAAAVAADRAPAGEHHTSSTPAADRTVSTPAADRTTATPAADRTTATPAADRTTGTPAATTDSTEHTGTKAGPTAVPAAAATHDNNTHDNNTHDNNPGGQDPSTYAGDYHPASLHPKDADYSDVQMPGEEPEGTKPTAEGELGASAATAGKTERDNDVAGLKEGGDRKLHGGVPGDIGGGTMPVGDSHEGGVDSADPKGKSVAHDRGATTDSAASDATHGSGKPKFMDKLKGEMKILSGKIGHKPEKVEEGQRLKTGGQAP